MHPASDGGERRKKVFERIRKEPRKLLGIQRKVARMIMREDAVKNATQRIGISTSAFYRERNKARRRLKKLKPIWVRFGKALQTRRFSA
jgi:transposase-like protein